MELREWRKQVFEKFDYTCDICGKRGKKLAAHHLANWADNPDSRFSVDNGVCLCYEHHWKFHNNWMGGPRLSCTANDYWEFKSSLNGSRSTDKSLQ